MSQAMIDGQVVEVAREMLQRALKRGDAKTAMTARNLVFEIYRDMDRRIKAAFPVTRRYVHKLNGQQG